MSAIGNERDWKLSLSLIYVTVEANSVRLLVKNGHKYCRSFVAAKGSNCWHAKDRVSESSWKVLRGFPEAIPEGFVG